MSEDKKDKALTDTPVVERAKKKTKNFNGIRLRDEEKLLINVRISNGIYWKAGAVCVLAFLIGLLAWQLGVFLLIVAGVTAGIAFLTKTILFLALTNQRVLVRRGIIKIDTLQLRLDSLESVEVQRTLVGQILGYASVVITGVGNRFTIVPFVANAVEFRDLLDDELFSKNKKEK
ncbi:MAG: PH domain-containing protein [Bdellovibrionales bacterium]